MAGNDIKTKIDVEELERFCERHPETEEFLVTYFYGIEQYNWVTGFREYVRGIEEEKRFEPAFSNLEDELLEAFFDITEDVDNTDEIEYLPLGAEEDESSDYKISRMKFTLYLPDST